MNEFIDVVKGSLVIIKGKKINNLYNLNRDPVWNRTITTSKDKLNVDPKFKYYNNINNVR